MSEKRFRVRFEQEDGRGERHPQLLRDIHHQALPALAEHRRIQRLAAVSQGQRHVGLLRPLRPRSVPAPYLLRLFTDCLTI